MTTTIMEFSEALRLCEGPSYEEHYFAYGDAVPYLPYTPSDVENCVSTKGLSFEGKDCIYNVGHHPDPIPTTIDMCGLPLVPLSAADIPKNHTVGTSYFTQHVLQYSLSKTSVVPTYHTPVVLTTISVTVEEVPAVQDVSVVPLSGSIVMLFLAFILLGLILLPKRKQK